MSANILSGQLSKGILYEIYSIGKTLEEHRSIERLSVSGSFASIPFYIQIIADVFNKSVAISKNADSTSFGFVFS